MTIKTAKRIFFALGAIILVTVLIGQCKSCKPDPDEPVVVTPEQIKTVYSPLYYELEKENKQLKRDKDSLTKENEVLATKVAAAKFAKQKAAVNVSIAEEKKDTPALVTSLKDEVKHANNTIALQENELKNERKLNKDNERIITNLETEVKLQKTEFNTLATSFQTQAGMLAQAKTNAEKDGKKIKKRGKIILGLIGVAVVEGIIISLQNR